MGKAAYRNRIRDVLAEGGFLFTLEYVPEGMDKPRKEVFAHLSRQAESVGMDPRIAGINIGDRVKSLNSYSTVECGRIVAEASMKTPLLHLAGKDREPAEARAIFQQALALGMDNMLVLTGDGITEPAVTGRRRYYDSVCGVVDLKHMAPSALAAVAVNPFKYREEEAVNQYLKLAKKLKAGADYVITNCGWDMRKLEELVRFRDARGLKTPLVANVLLPQKGWAKGIHAGRLPGVFMSDDLFAKISEERRLPDAEAAGMRRLVLQIVGARKLGYAGVHVSGVEQYDQLCEVIERVSETERALASRADWEAAWLEANTIGGRPVDFAHPAAMYLYAHGDKASEGRSEAPAEAVASDADLRRANRLELVHRLAFKEGSAGAAVLGAVVRATAALPMTEAGLRKVEHAIKSPLLGCEMCGFCRIEYLSYICPETCPKGLANGPCGGTNGNQCEFGDRECIHNRKYRIAKAQGMIADLEDVYIPPVEGSRSQSSWLNEFRHATPKVRRLK